MASISQTLLTDVKNYLDITWNDDATDAKISGIIASGIQYLRTKGGGCVDFENDMVANQLLKDYVRYARDSALDVFENNYRSMILMLQIGRKVDAHVEDAE